MICMFMHRSQVPGHPSNVVRSVESRRPVQPYREGLCVLVCGLTITVTHTALMDGGGPAAVVSIPCMYITTPSHTGCASPPPGRHRATVVVGWWFKRPSNMLVYLRDGSARTVVRAATLRQKMQIMLSTSPRRSILTPGLPVPAPTL